MFRLLLQRQGADQLYEAGIEFLPMPADMPSLHDVAAQLDQSDAT